MDSNKLPFSLFDFFALIFPGAIGMFGLYWLFDPGLQVIQTVKIDLTITFILIILSYLIGHVLHAASEILIYHLANFTVGSIVGEYLYRVGLANQVKKGPLKRILNYVTNFTRGEWDPDILFEWNKQFEDKHISDIKAPLSTSAALDRKFGKLIKARLEIEFQTVPQRINHIFQLVLAFSQKNTKSDANEVPAFAAIETMFRSLTLATSILFIIFLAIRSSNISVDFFAICIVFLLFIALFLYSHRRYKRMWVETIFAQFIVASLEKHPVAKDDETLMPEKK